MIIPRFHASRAVQENELMREVKAGEDKKQENKDKQTKPEKQEATIPSISSSE
jgi:hypothetical protein